MEVTRGRNFQFFNTHRLSWVTASADSMLMLSKPGEFVLCRDVGIADCDILKDMVDTLILIVGISKPAAGPSMKTSSPRPHKRPLDMTSFEEIHPADMRRTKKPRPVIRIDSDDDEGIVVSWKDGKGKAADPIDLTME